MAFFIPVDNVTFKVLYCFILYWYYVKTKWNYNTLTVPCEKFEMVSFASSIIKNIVVLQLQICCIAFGSASSACCLFKSIAIIL